MADEEDVRYWRQYFGWWDGSEPHRTLVGGPPTDEELTVLDGFGTPYEDFTSDQMLGAYRAGGGAVESARTAAVTLEQECAVLTDTLGLFTHEYEPDLHRTGYCHVCGYRADRIQHRTPAWLRKRHGLGV